MQIVPDGLDAALKLVREQSSRMTDMTPAFKTFGAYVTKEVDDCFDKSVDWDGKAFPPLAESTVGQRVGNLKAANKRTKAGQLTKAALALQNKLRSPGGIKPLVDTSRARNSQHCDSGKDFSVWTAVGYLFYHVTGSIAVEGRPPMRNVSPFILRNGGWTLHKRAQAQLEAIVARFVQRGSTAVEAAE